MNRIVTTTAPALTTRQRQALEFIVDYADEHGISPSLDEIRVALGARSIGSAVNAVDGLERKRYIHRRYSTTRSSPRAIEVLRVPADLEGARS